VHGRTVGSTTGIKKTRDRPSWICMHATCKLAMRCEARGSDQVAVWRNGICMQYARAG
jgi:hypothetical protein